MPVSVCDPVDGSFPFVGADLFGGFDFDQTLHSQLSELTDKIGPVPAIERELMPSQLGMNPAPAGEVIRIAMPALTEETRKVFGRQARHEAESARVSIRNGRRDANGMLKELVKDKEISEDEERRGQDIVQKLTDAFIARVEKLLGAPAADLMEI